MLWLLFMFDKAVFTFTEFASEIIYVYSDQIFFLT